MEGRPLARPVCQFLVEAWYFIAAVALSRVQSDGCSRHGRTSQAFKALGEGLDFIFVRALTLQDIGMDDPFKSFVN